MITALVVGGLLVMAVVAWRTTPRPTPAPPWTGITVSSRPLSTAEDHRHGSWKAVAWRGETRVTVYGFTRAGAEGKARRQLVSLLDAHARTRTTGGAA